jgi:hypothetical protein
MVGGVPIQSFFAKPGDRFSGFRAFGIASLLLLAAVPFADAAPRTWRNAGGTRSFRGEYLRHDARRVTIRRQGGRVFTLDIDKLHADDRAWLAAQAKPASGGGNVPAPQASGPDDVAVFDTIKLGDSHAEVRRKLEESKALELTMDRTYLARFGLNGTYRTKQEIGGQHCLLYFDWTKNRKGELLLHELSLQTEPVSAASYSKRLRATWVDLAKLLSALHGPPVQAAEFPAIADLSTDGMFLASHLWRLENGNSILLGTVRDAGRYSVGVRFTTDAIAPVKK